MSNLSSSRLSAVSFASNRMSKENAQRHLDLIQRDADCAHLLANSARNASPRQDVSDWLITIQFYILCHYVKALGQCKGKEFVRHFDLRQWMNEETDLVPITREYRKAEERSREARYHGRLFPVDKVERFNDWFETVRDNLTIQIHNAGLSSPPSIDPIEPGVVSP